MSDAASFHQLRARARAQLVAAGIQGAVSDVDWILADVLGVSRSALISEPPLTIAQAEQFLALVDRRSGREPLQHLLGQAWFRHLTLAVGPGVFIPRPETEFLIDLALAAPALAEVERPAMVVDLCTGSGAIALALATERPNTRVVAVELLPAALAWTNRNIDSYRQHLADVGSSVELVAGDAGASHELLTHLLGSVDVVTCNPPYIPKDAVPRDPEVRDYDPARALYGGDDGLDVVRDVVRAAARLLRPGGALLIEHGDAQGVEAGQLGVPAAVAESGEFADVNDHVDLTERPRVTVATRRPQPAVGIPREAQSG
ncbi:MAG: peptide chain release factor N(5)-glutamine methyltransferase [Candidatus Nanopelagicales bacterium]